MLISKGVGYTLLFLSVASCILVGMLVHYITLSSMECSEEPHNEQLQSDRPLDPSHDNKQDLKKKVTDVRLPTHLRPDKYRLWLVPFLQNSTIDGQVEITLHCLQGGSTNVTVHINDIDVDEDTVQIMEMGAIKNSGLSVKAHRYDEDRQFYIVLLNKPLEKGKSYVIKMHFKALLPDGLDGFYRSSYKDEIGQTRYLATTQFQATDARKAFPCLDEPALKARFEVSLGRRKNMSSISNMPIKTRGVPMKKDPNFVWDHFQESVPMSTYLVAFVVSDFDHVTSKPVQGNNVTFKIWARRNALDQVEFANSIGAKILRYFETFFNVPFPLPKQDMIAMPDFGAGAMENWGLITYRETALLFKPGVSSNANKQRIAVVVSHELAHQWFGNLVTPSWWTDLWLNEGFASYVEYLGVEAVQPELRLLDQFIVSDLQQVMRVDALKSSHPVSIPVRHPDEISEIFDRISYGKGASIIRMMDHFLTTGTFRKGLTNYLNAFKYKAAEQDDLWHHLSAQAHRDERLPKDTSIKKIMDTWTLQMGFPVVTVHRDYEKGLLRFTQKRFLLNNDDTDINADKDDKEYKWWVPITVAEPNGNFNATFAKHWLRPDQSELVVSQGVPAPNKPVIVNVRQTAYYRVNYDERNWERLVETLNANHESIDLLNRAQIIDDALNLARAGQLNYSLAMSVTSYLHKETDYVPWRAALLGLSYLDIMLKRTPAYGEFKIYVERLIRPLYNQVGFRGRSGEAHLDVFLRRTVVRWACGLELIDACVQNAATQWRKWMDQLNPDLIAANPIDVNLKRDVYCTAIQKGKEKEWEFGWQRYRASNVATERDILLSALACTKETWLLNRYLNMSLTSGSGIRQQDARRVISEISNNVHGRDLAFDFIRNKWDHVLKYYEGSSFGLASIVKAVLRDRNTEFDIQELKEFEATHRGQLSSGEREVRQAIEQAENNLVWMERNFDTIFTWLKEHNNVKRY